MVRIVEPRLGEVDVQKPVWGQKLVFPQQFNRITAGFKQEAPGYWITLDAVATVSIHYGTDFSQYKETYEVSDKNLYALGVGRVIRSLSGDKKNSDMGNVLQVLYENVIMPDNATKDIVALYAHLSDILIDEDDMVYTGGKVIAVMGNKVSLFLYS